MSEDWRIGIGYDQHPMSLGTPLFLGGVHIPYGSGLEGHVDGDVVLHAVIDALLGAAGLPDVIERFPENLEQLARSLGLPLDKLQSFGVRLPTGDGAGPEAQPLTSQVMLSQSLEEVLALDWTVNNVDVTILARKPNLSPYKLAIRKSLSELLHVNWERISVKANINFAMGAADWTRTIACQAALTLQRTTG